MNTQDIVVNSPINFVQLINLQIQNIGEIGSFLIYETYAEIENDGEGYLSFDGQNDYVDFRKILRSDYSDEYIKDKIKFALKIKPKSHDFVINKDIQPYMTRYMNMTGG